MDFGRLNSWLQLAANIGLVLVGVQLKQNSDLILAPQRNLEPPTPTE